MAETAISAVLSKLGELAVIEAHVRYDSVQLCSRLERLQAFVRDADRRRRAGTDGLTRVRVCQIRDMAFDAEDALDDFFNEQVVVQKDQGSHRGWKAVRRHFTGLLTKVMVRHRLAGRIKMIKSRLDKISANKQEYQIGHTPSMVLASSTTAIAAWRDNLENAVVLDRDVEIVKKMLVRKDEHSLFFFMRNGPQHPMFISIVGDRGAGKNTLAKIIHREMRSEMKMLVRCDMEPGSSMTDFLGKVYECASLLLCYDYEREMIAEEQGWDISDKLRRLLAGKRYLLILGGISSITILNFVRASLPNPNNDNNSGGCVMLILDTENEEVAWHANTMNIGGVNGVHVLTHLDQKRSGQLFLWKVLRKSQEGISRVSNQEEEDGRYEEVVYRITGGHPMAIVLLAGLLRFKQKPVQWEAVLQQLKSVYPPPLESNIRAIEIIFWASFEDLPRDIKSCFLYFAAYLNSTGQYADELVRMWIGEGFIKPQNRTMAEGGNDYLKELVLRCLVEVEEMKDGGGIQLVRVHKSLMGFLQSEVRESGFMEIINDNDMHDVLEPQTVRRLSVYGRRYTSTFTKNKFPKLHSFICHIIDKDAQLDFHDLEFLCSSKFIRIISVQGLRLERLPDRIGDMINLRYLRIDSQFLQELPASFSGLLNLQTLDIRNTEVEEIDLDVWKIKTLRHVLATKLKLPTTRPVVVEETEDDAGVSELQTLHGVRLDISGGWCAGKCPLDKMTSLLSLELEMHGFEQERHGLPPFKEALQNMRRLGHLDLRGDRIPSCVFTHQNLKGLKTMVLHGTVNWNKIVPDNNQVAGHFLRKARPNLIQVKLRDTNHNQVPKIIREQLGTILIKDD